MMNKYGNYVISQYNDGKWSITKLSTKEQRVLPNIDHLFEGLFVAPQQTASSQFITFFQEMMHSEPPNDAQRTILALCDFSKADEITHYVQQWLNGYNLFHRTDIALHSVLPTIRKLFEVI